jgi:hypothetical protein
MEPVLSSIIGALVAGAVASAGKVGGKVVSDAYEGLKELIIAKLKKKGVVTPHCSRPRTGTRMGRTRRAGHWRTCSASIRRVCSALK